MTSDRRASWRVDVADTPQAVEALRRAAGALGWLVVDDARLPGFLEPTRGFLLAVPLLTAADVRAELQRAGVEPRRVTM